MTAPNSLDDEFEGFDELDDEEWASRMDELAGRGPERRLLPSDLAEVYDGIADAELRRKLGGHDQSPYMFEGFEALRCVLGGMGMIIEARDPVLERKVALKFWMQSGATGQAALLSEAKTLARFSHPNIVTVHDIRRWGERVYFVMEWIDGVDGKTWMVMPLPSREVCDVFVEAARGLAAAHDRGIQHRDFKPENMLIGDDGRVVVADFGIAESLRSTDDADPRWANAGTPTYMAPERLRGEPGDARSDQFSFFVALYRGLYGFRPFFGVEPEQLLEAIVLGVVRTDDDAEVPQWLFTVMLRGLAANPDERYADMHEVIVALGEPPSEEPREDEGEQDEDKESASVSAPLPHARNSETSTSRDAVTPSNLVDGKPWALWGPRTDRMNGEAIGLLARLTGRPEAELADRLLRVAHTRRYFLLEQLAGRPGAPVVYAGVDGLLAREVVIKIHRDGRQHAADRAIRECQAMAQFDHPNVLKIHDVGEQGRWLYSVTEYCEADLRVWYFDLGWAEILTRIIEVARGLACLHEHGYAHGDIKPANVLIRGGIAKLADFGHAAKPGAHAFRLGDYGEQVTMVEPGGTAGYVAPEVREHGPSFAADVFSLAVTTYVCLFGELPFPLPPAPPGENVPLFATAEQVESRELRAPSTVPVGLPTSVLPLLKRALDPNPKLRPSLDELTRGLQAAVEQALRRKKRERIVPGVAVVTVITLAIGFSAGALSSQRSDEAGSIVDAALSAMSPVARADIALRAGDVDAAMGLIYRAYDESESSSTHELLALADGAKNIAVALQNTGKTADAIDAWFFVARFYDRAGRPQQAMEARKAREELIVNLDLYRSK